MIGQVHVTSVFFHACANVLMLCQSACSSDKMIVSYFTDVQVYLILLSFNLLI